MDQNLPQNQNPSDNQLPGLGGLSDTPTASNYPTEPIDPYNQSFTAISGTNNVGLNTRSVASLDPKTSSNEQVSNFDSQVRTVTTIAGITSESGSKNAQVKKGKGSKVLIFSLILVPLLLVFLGIGAFAAAAYEVLPLPAKYRDMAVNVVNKISFMPKSSRMILYNTASTKIFERSYINGSFKTQTDDPMFNQLFGTDSTTLKFEGPLIRENGLNDFAFKLSMVDVVDLQIHHFNSTLYFNILNAITPDRIMPNLPNTWGYNNPIFNRWVEVNSTELNQGLNQIFGDDTETQSALMGDSEEVLDAFREDVIPFVTTTKEELDGVKVYKLSYYPTDGQVAELITKLSKLATTASTVDAQEVNPTMQNASPVVMKDVKLDLWVEASTFKIRKHSSTAIISTSISPVNYSNVLGATTPVLAQTREQLIQAQGQSLSDINLTSELQIDPLDDATSVIVPQDTVKFEEYSSSVMNHLKKLMAPPVVIEDDDNGIDEGAFGFEQASVRQALPANALSTEDLNLLGVQ
ncbi:MAG: hypothetical protein QG570_491 [Patescibacteria group bacterium]|nr:hypothetical protein [Patescibacteria group bacterium]